MSMDLIYLEAIIRELQEKLGPAAVSKIHQSGEHDLVFRFWTGRENLRLLLSVDPRACRLYLTTAKLPNPQTPPRFCQLLRARLSRLLEIERLPGERIVRLTFRGEEGEIWTLIAELLGPRANLILLDAGGKIVDCLHRQDGEGRQILPGLPYLPPQSAQRFDLDSELPPIPGDRPLRPWLLESVTPMTPLLAADLEAAVASGVPPELGLERLRERWSGRVFQPAIATWQGKSQLVALLPEYLELIDLQSFTTPSQAADRFYAAVAEEELFSGGPQELERLVRKQLIRLEKRLAAIAAEETKAHGSERQRQLGDLLLAHLHQLRRGLSEITVEDWYADPLGAVTIPLDPALLPQENAERYFRLHRKGKRGLEHILRRRSETLAEIEWLGGILLGLDEANTPEELIALREELQEAGVLKIRLEPGRRSRPATEAALRQAVTPGGFRLIWGKNNRSNDQVSCRMTAPEDLWFHAHQLPGCHLVLKREGRSGAIPEEDIRFAAALAAGYSRGKDATKVEVIVSEGRMVKKPKGARPGLVTVERFYTVVVAPRRLEDNSDS